MWKCWLTCVKVWSVLKLNAHSSCLCGAHSLGWWQWPNLCGCFSQLRKLCDVLTGVTDAGAAWRQPFPSMNARRQISNLFLFLIELCWKGQLFAYGNLFCFSRFGGCVCSLPLLVLFYFSFSALPDLCVSDVTIWGDLLSWKRLWNRRGSCRCTAVAPGVKYQRADPATKSWGLWYDGTSSECGSPGRTLDGISRKQRLRTFGFLLLFQSQSLLFALIAGTAQQTVRGKHKCPITDFSPPVLWRMPFPCHRLLVTVIFSES